jgi:ribosomal protein S18 acetylase RimI-like enzyme
VDVKIAPLTDEDLDLAVEAIAAGEIFQRYGLTRARARDLLMDPAHRTVVARVNGKTVGVAVYWTDGRTPVPAYLRLLAVHEGSRDEGIGMTLLRFVEEQAFRKGPNLFLCCATTNLGARRFYERYGYQAVGVLHGLVVEGIDEILYRKTLGPIQGYVPPD